MSVVIALSTAINLVSDALPKGLYKIQSSGNVALQLEKPAKFNRTAMRKIFSRRNPKSPNGNGRFTGIAKARRAARIRRAMKARAPK